MVEVDDREVLAEQALRTHYDITRVGQDLLTFVAARNRAPRLADLLLRRSHRTQRMVVGSAAGRRAARLSRTCDARPLIGRHAETSATTPVFDFLQPDGHPAEVQLTVAVVRYKASGRRRSGVCSTFLADRARDTSRCPYSCRIRRISGRLRSESPMIMVGPGTGIAPFRGFLHERRARGAAGRNWLFFGDQHAATDFYYRDELEDMRERLPDPPRSGLSPATRREKIYVQHRMLEQGADSWAWLEEGAHFYVCGDANRMARDVDTALKQLIQDHGSLSREAAETYVSKMAADKNTREMFIEKKALRSALHRS